MNIATIPVSLEARSVLYIIQEYGQMSEKELLKLIGKSKRTLYRYLAEIRQYISQKNFIYSLSDLSPVSKYLNINQDQNTYLQHIDTNDKIDELRSILAKYGKEHLVKTVYANIPEINTAAVEFILKYVLERQKKSIVKAFTPYFISCLHSMWEQAVGESQKNKEQEQIVLKIEQHQDTSPIDDNIQNIWLNEANENTIAVKTCIANSNRTIKPLTKYYNEIIQLIKHKNLNWAIIR